MRMKRKRRRKRRRNRKRKRRRRRHVLKFFPETQGSVSEFWRNSKFFLKNKVLERKWWNR